MKTTHNLGISGRRNALPSRKEELAAKIFMGGIVALIVAIDVLALVYAK